MERRYAPDHLALSTSHALPKSWHGLAMELPQAYTEQVRLGMQLAKRYS